MHKTIATLFTGYDLFGMGAEQAGYINVFGVDNHQPAVDFCHRNNNHRVVCGDVRTHDYSYLKGLVQLFHFSPECKSFSDSNIRGREKELDREFARAIVRAIAQSEPPYVSLENVPSYRNSESFEIILSYLEQDYYYWVSDYCTADYGVPQTRDRLILRAIRKDQNRLLVPVIPPTHSKYPEDGLLPWVSWYDAIADIIPNLKPIALTNWQKRSLDEQGFDITGQTVLISKDGSRKKKGYEHTFALVIPKDSPVPTIKAMGHDQHCQQYVIVIDGNVFRISTEALARWQTVPNVEDKSQHGIFANADYVNCMGLGNGVPSLFAQRIVESFDL